MINLYDDIKKSLQFKKFQLDDLLFAQYTCPLPDEFVEVWSHTGYFVHVISGIKTWHTHDGAWRAEKGQTVFFKKGAAVVQQDFSEDFCLLLVFVPDKHIKSAFESLDNKDNLKSQTISSSTAIRVQEDVGLLSCISSMLSYFSNDHTPHEELLKHKLHEFIISTFMSHHNDDLRNYFLHLANHLEDSMETIMENNFKYRLSLDELARLCSRSTSTFKRDFKKIFNTTPGKWLQNKRLHYSAELLRTTSRSVSEIALSSGFESFSHYSTAFKSLFKSSPRDYRENIGLH